MSRAYAVCAGWPQIFGKTPLLLKKSVLIHIVGTDIIIELDTYITIFENFFQTFDDSLVQKGTFLGATFLPLTLLATSLIEEEHFTFYFTLSTLYFLLFYQCLRYFLHTYFFSDWSSSTTYRDIILSYEEEPIHNRFISLHPCFYTLQIHLWSCFDSIWKCLFHYQLYDKAKYKPLFMHFIPNLVIVYMSSCLFRLCREFNSNGDKWRNIERLNDYLKHSHLLQFTVLIGIFIAFLLYYRYSFVLVSLALFGIYGRHYSIFSFTTDINRTGLFETQIAYLCIFLLFLLGFFKLVCFFFNSHKSFSKLCNNSEEHVNLCKTDICVQFLQYCEVAVALIYLLIQKPENVLLTSLLYLHFHLIFPVFVKNFKNLGLSPWHLYVIVYWISHAHFFMEVRK